MVPESLEPPAFLRGFNQASRGSPWYDVRTSWWRPRLCVIMTGIYCLIAGSELGKRELPIAEAWFDASSYALKLFGGVVFVSMSLCCILELLDIESELVCFGVEWLLFVDMLIFIISGAHALHGPELPGRISGLVVLICGLCAARLLLNHVAYVYVANYVDHEGSRRIPNDILSVIATTRSRLEDAPGVRDKTLWEILGEQEVLDWWWPFRWRFWLSLCSLSAGLLISAAFVDDAGNVSHLRPEMVDRLGVAVGKFVTPLAACSLVRAMIVCAVEFVSVAEFFSDVRVSDGRWLLRKAADLGTQTVSGIVLVCIGGTLVAETWSDHLHSLPTWIAGFLNLSIGVHILQSVAASFLAHPFLAQLVDVLPDVDSTQEGACTVMPYRSRDLHELTEGHSGSWNIRTLEFVLTKHPWQGWWARTILPLQVIVPCVTLVTLCKTLRPEAINVEEHQVFALPLSSVLDLLGEIAGVCIGLCFTSILHSTSSILNIGMAGAWASHSLATVWLLIHGIIDMASHRLAGFLIIVLALEQFHQAILSVFALMFCAQVRCEDTAEEDVATNQNVLRRIQNLLAGKCVTCAEDVRREISIDSTYVALCRRIAMTVVFIIGGCFLRAALPIMDGIVGRGVFTTAEAESIRQQVTEPLGALMIVLGILTFTSCVCTDLAAIFLDMDASRSHISAISSGFNVAWLVPLGAGLRGSEVVATRYVGGLIFYAGACWGHPFVTGGLRCWSRVGLQQLFDDGLIEQVPESGQGLAMTDLGKLWRGLNFIISLVFTIVACVLQGEWGAIYAQDTGALVADSFAISLVALCLIFVSAANVVVTVVQSA